MIEARPALSGGIPPQETSLIHGTGIIFAVPENRYLFFRRSNDPLIPYPGRIALIGGRCMPGESGHQAARREAHEEVHRRITRRPVTLNPEQLVHLATLPDDRPGIIDVFGYELGVDPSKLRTREGQGLVVLSANEVLATDFPYSYTGVIHEYVGNRQSQHMASFCTEATVLRAAG